MKNWHHLVRSGLRSDYQLAIITTFGVCAIFGIMPFALYRFATDNPWAGFVDLGIVAAICFAVVHARRSGDRTRASMLLALETLATQDALTGVLNRRAMEQELQIAVEALRRDGSSFGLAMLDLDHFKRINDEHGHEAGDEVLIGFVGLVRHATRKVDRCFRFGGEEFVLLMPGIGSAALHGIDESLRIRIASELNYGGEPVTVSIGAAALRPGEDWQSWLARADAALYQAKHEGRNRTVIDTEQAESSD